MAGPAALPGGRGLTGALGRGRTAAAEQLRAAGCRVGGELTGRSVKAQMKYANKLGARLSMVLGENELAGGRASVKDMATGEQKEIAFTEELSNLLYDAMLAREADELAEQLGPDAFKRTLGMERP